MKIDKIPTLPMVAMQVLRYDYSSESASSVELANLISPDKAICGEILKIANSAFYGRSGSVMNIKDAVTLLGLKTVKNLVIFLVSNKISNSLRNPVFKKQLTEFPIFSALIALDLANAMDLRNRIDDAFLLALLHRVGMVVIAMNDETRYSSLLEKLETGGQDLLRLERETFGMDSVEASKMVFDLWKLPKEFHAIVENVYKPMEELMMADPMVYVVLLSSLLARVGLGMHVSQSDLSKIDELFSYFPDPDRLEESMNQDYYELLKEHPFFAQVVGE